MKKFIQTIFVLLILSIAGSGSAYAQKHIMVPAEKADKVMKKKNLEVLDVRTPEEVQAGHLPDAVNYDFKSADFESMISALPRNKPYLVYCRSGVRSGKTVELMKSLGFKKIYELKGGITAYDEAKKKE